jgi:hypothetical protein
MCAERSECGSCGYYVCPHCREQDATGGRGTRIHNHNNGGGGAGEGGGDSSDEEVDDVDYESRVFISACGRCSKKCCQKALRGAPEPACMLHCDCCRKNLCPSCIGEHWQCEPCKSEFREEAARFIVGGEVTTMCGKCVASRGNVSCPRHLR